MDSFYNPLFTHVNVFIPKDDSDWHDKRREGLGASESAVLLGLSGYSTAYQLYCLKKGIIADTQPEDERMILGRNIEEGILKTYSEVYNQKVRHNKEHMILISKEFPFLMFTPDGMVDDGEPFFVEVKSSVENSIWRDYQGNIKIPDNVYCQLQHQMLVSGTTRILLVLELFHTIHPIWVKRDEALIQDIQIEADIFEYQLANNIEPDVKDGDTSILNRQLAKKNLAEPIKLGNEFEVLAKQLQRLNNKLAKENKRLKVTTKKRDAIQNRIKKEINGVGVAELPNGRKFVVTKTGRGGKYQKKSYSLRLKSIA